MRITLIDGARSGPASDRIGSALGIRASRLHVHRLEEETVAPCRGSFECWTDHPGVCGTRDHAQFVLQDLLAADVVAWVTRPRFGAWDARSKGVLDRSLGLLLPVLETTPDGETRARTRYPHYPRWIVFAVGGGRAEQRKLFRRLVGRNVANLRAEPPWIEFFDDEVPLASMDAAVERALAAPEPGLGVKRPPASDWLSREGVPGGDRSRHVLVWVGSAKAPGASSSEALGRALAERLVARGWTMEVIGGLSAAREPDRLIAAVERSDLVVPTAPVYVDTLPGIVLAGLGQLVDRRALRRTAWLPIVQCGLPELSHTALAVETFQHAVGDRGDAWCGHLAMAQGEMLQGRSPGEVSRARHQVQALDEAAEAIDVGHPLPGSVTAEFGRTTIPSSLYRAAGRAGWLWRALRSGSLGQLEAQPLHVDS